MHPVVFYFAAVWLVGLMIVAVILVIRARSVMVRVLAFDTMALIAVALLVLFAHENRSSFYLDAALMIALLSFVGTLAAARYLTGRNIFS